MRRTWLHLLVLLGLAAASLHAPAMALPEPAPLAVALHVDCHGDMADTPAGETWPADLSCCPDGCSGGCLPAGTMMPARGLAGRVAVRTVLPIPGVERPGNGAAEGPFHPPRTLA